MSRRLRGTHWRGHKLYATLNITAGSTIYRPAREGSTIKTLADCSVRAWKPCRANGQPLANVWQFVYLSYLGYLKDKDAASVSEQRIHQPVRRNKDAKAGR